MWPHALGSAVDRESRRGLRRFGSVDDAGVKSIPLPGVEPQLCGGLGNRHSLKRLQLRKRHRSMCKRACDRRGYCIWCHIGHRILWWLEALFQERTDADPDQRAPFGECRKRRPDEPSSQAEDYRRLRHCASGGLWPMVFPKLKYPLGLREGRES